MNADEIVSWSQTEKEIVYENRIVRNSSAHSGIARRGGFGADSAKVRGNVVRAEFQDQD
jgi:hypothetical protein